MKVNLKDYGARITFPTMSCSEGPVLYFDERLVQSWIVNNGCKYYSSEIFADIDIILQESTYITVTLPKEFTDKFLKDVLNDKEK